MPSTRATAHRLAAATAVLGATTGLLTTVHHVIRLGPEVVIPGVLVTLAPAALLHAYRRTSRTAALVAAAVVNLLVFVWFGFVDGFLDHVLKAVGLANVTLLPGGEAEVVDTYYVVGTPAASDLLYEGTGVLTFVASTLTLTLTGLLLRAAHRSRAAAPDPVGSAAA